MTNLFTIARLEAISAVRLKWIQLLTVAFALLSAAAAYSAGAASEMTGTDNFARTTMALVPVVVILVPLAAVILGVSGQASDAGSDPFLFSQPIGRTVIVVGRWIGEWVALGGAVIIGFGVGGCLVAANAGFEGIGKFAWFVAAALTLAAIFLSLAAVVAASTERRITALGFAVFVWFFFVLLYDGIALSLAGSLSGSTGGHVLFASIFGNPADLIRVVMLLVSGTANVLGAAGEAWIRFLGGDLRATIAAAAAVTLWIAAPLGVAVLTLRTRDL